jgi:hypothetical protein
MCQKWIIHVVGFLEQKRIRKAEQFVPKAASAMSVPQVTPGHKHKNLAHLLLEEGSINGGRDVEKRVAEAKEGDCGQPSPITQSATA